MINKPCDECCHINVCKHEGNVRNYVEEIKKKPIPIDNELLTMTVTCGLSQPKIITAKTGTELLFGNRLGGTT